MLKIACVDLTHEQTSTRLQHIIDDERAWTAHDIDPDNCILKIGSEAESEILRVVEQMRLNPLPKLLRTPSQFNMPAMSQIMKKSKALVAKGLGVAVIDALPLDQFDQNDAVALFWVLGQLLGRPVAQKWDGTMLYDVRDTGQPYSYGVRGSYTNVELFFHTDNAFGIVPPHYVGLMCVQPAAKGGTSRFCSLYSVHNRMLTDYTRQLERLYRPLLWDRQAEHARGQPKVALAPMFRFDGERLTARANVSLVRKGYEVAEVSMDAETSDALDALEFVADNPSLWFELPLERGHLQYLNNLEVGHYRSEFTDHSDPALKRHLVRMWHRDTGYPTYDG